MRAVVQRVSRAAVRVGSETTGEIGPGLLVLVGVHREDSGADAAYVAEKAANLRIFDDDEGRMDRSALETESEVLVVSQFTLHGDARKGRRPSYGTAASGETAERLYEEVCTRLRDMGLRVETGRFGAEMQVDSVGEGPVTILLDSSRGF